MCNDRIFLVVTQSVALPQNTPKLWVLKAVRRKFHIKSAGIGNCQIYYGAPTTFIGAHDTR